MDALRTGVFVLFALLVPGSCKDAFFTEPVTCYFLDGILIIYCIIATALYFREKFSYIPVAVSASEENGGIYQELDRPKDSDPYQVLEPLKKKKAGKKKKAKPSPAQGDKDPYESLMTSPSAPPPPLSPR
ncbi:T-cell surface glycoprotein CD3 zeta chain-like isoform X2 [Morone saxatilis]|uniref:T-cell surface glycoprotein CD3 zeta chain-like isoform X2 n=1 Tax=Morone saxatilis TaxID=34816 RepID=UPI0015E2106B|nr:T-cell surface glycoprotein CD3 zeta chain-like isoform X2 [Morone saxatilis]